MMVKCANDGLLQANASEMLVNDGEMSVCSYTLFKIPSLKGKIAVYGHFSKLAPLQVLSSQVE